MMKNYSAVTGQFLHHQMREYNTSSRMFFMQNDSVTAIFENSISDQKSNLYCTRRVTPLSVVHGVEWRGPFLRLSTGAIQF